MCSCAPEEKIMIINGQLCPWGKNNDNKCAVVPPR